MILFFKAGWIRLALGAGFLYTALALVHRGRGITGPIFQHFQVAPVFSIHWVKWVPLGIALDILLILLYFSLGAMLAPKLFPRAFLTSCARLFARHGPLLVLGCGVFAAGLEEPLFRWEIQKQLMSDVGAREGVVLAALLQAAACWTPLTHLLTGLMFLRGLLYGLVYQISGHPLAPVMVHGVGELLFIGGIALMGRFGLTSIPPEEPRGLTHP